MPASSFQGAFSFQGSEIHYSYNVASGILICDQLADVSKRQFTTDGVLMPDDDEEIISRYQSWLRQSSIKVKALPLLYVLRAMRCITVKHFKPLKAFKTLIFGKYIGVKNGSELQVQVEQEVLRMRVPGRVGHGIDSQGKVDLELQRLSVC